MRPPRVHGCGLAVVDPGDLLLPGERDHSKVRRHSDRGELLCPARRQEEEAFVAGCLTLLALVASA